MAWPITFGSLAGPIPLSDIDANFAVAAFASDLTALAAVVAALPGAATPLVPTALGAAGADAQFSREDHQHPAQNARISLQTGTTYTLQTTDNGAVVELQNAAAIALTLPDSLPAEFNCLIVQTGAGQATLAAAGGATLHQASSLTKTRAQWSMISLYIRANAGGNAAVYVVGGDMA